MNFVRASVSGAMRTFALLIVIAEGSARAQTQIAHTLHNLSADGSGQMRGNRTAGVCIFCHTPHNARPTRALWNRDLPAITYKLYESSTMHAQVNQPTGSSRLCLSCHDGILALSKVRMHGGGTMPAMTPLGGRDSLGIDLSNDHPISFIYNSALALRAGDLAEPAALPRSVPLERGRMQCASCHDPHEDRQGNFLRVGLQFGKACTVCHRERYWRNSSHATSTATWHGGGPKPWPNDGLATVAQNACLSCHRVHDAPHPARLLAQPVEEQNCTICHSGSMDRKNLDEEFSKPSHHPIRSREWTHDPAEDPRTMPRHVTCVDCHNPHAATASARTNAQGLPGSMRGVTGVSMGGATTKEAAFEYEVCFKCHGLSEPAEPGIIRYETTRNIRVRINPGNASYHPIAAPGKNRRMPGLLPPYQVSSIISCTDCHNNDQWTAGSAAPRGPHGSRFEPILQMEYDTVDPGTESYSSYAMCYKCHDRSRLLYSFGGFPHRRHVIDQHIPCAVCHDAHGSRRNPHLIDFMMVGKLGEPVVRPAKSGRLAYIADTTRPGHGKCYVSCHNTQHNPAVY